MTGAARAAAALVTATIGAFALGCGEPVTPEPLPDYRTWKRLEVRGTAPGHGDTFRVIFANPIAADPAQTFVGGYADGSILVKEIYNLDADRMPAGLRYVAIMRQDRDDPALDDEGGWLFTQSDVPFGDETYAPFCWQRCHVAAPYVGAWYDYRR